MKTLKDKFVSDCLWYLVVDYMNDTRYKVVEKWIRYDERGSPIFHLEWLTYEEFSQLVKFDYRGLIEEGLAIDVTGLKIYC